MQEFALKRIMKENVQEKYPNIQPTFPLAVPVDNRRLCELEAEIRTLHKHSAEKNKVISALKKSVRCPNF